MAATGRGSGDVAPRVAARLERLRVDRLAGEVGCGGTAAALLLVGAVVGFATALPASLAAVPLAIGVWLLVSLVAGALDSRVVRLVPFFSERVAGPFTLLRGRAILRWSGLLDRIAGERGRTPLTDYLCDDPLRGGEAVWHDPADAVATLDALIAALPEHRGDVPGYEDLLRDCLEWRERLANAADGGVSFFVMLRVGDGISLHEMSLRNGDF